MSKSVYKQEYNCECGQHFGNCFDKSEWVLVYYGVSDTYKLFHTLHSNTENSVTTDTGICLSEDGLTGLIKCLTSNTETKLNDQQRDFIFKQ